MKFIKVTMNVIGLIALFLSLCQPSTFFAENTRAGNIGISVRDYPTVVFPGARVEITADFINNSGAVVNNAAATLTLPAGAALHADYSWNTVTQNINGVGTLLVPKQLPAALPRLYAFGSDDFNSPTDITESHLNPFHEKGLRMSANILASALYFDCWNPNSISYYGTNLNEYLKKMNHEIGYHSYHHSHMGLCLHTNSSWVGISGNLQKRGKTWGIPNNETEQKMELLLGKYWDELYFDRRMEGFRSPFLEFDIAEGAETSTTTPLRSAKWKVIGKLGLRYVCTVNEGPSGWPPQEIGPTPMWGLDPRTCVPTWVPLCDEVTVAGIINDAYTDFSHHVYNILVGTQRLNINGTWTWGTIFDDSLIYNFDYATSMNFLKRYTDRHFTVTQNQIPHVYLNGLYGPEQSQTNIPLSFGLHPYLTNHEIPENWQTENKEGYRWVYDIHDYLKSQYADAKNVTHKDILDYYLGQGTIRWVVNMPTAPGNYNFTIQAPNGSSQQFQVQVKAPAAMYADLGLKGIKADLSADFAGIAAKGYSGVIYTVKGQDGINHSGADLDTIIAKASAQGLDVYCHIDVFNDTNMHTTQTLDYTGNVVGTVAEPTDQAYRSALKNIINTIKAKNIQGIILELGIPTSHSDGATVGYSNAMVSHFKKYFGPPPTGGNSQDPTSDTDPNYFSIYSPAATSEWRSGSIAWLYYDIRKLAYEFIINGSMANLPPDSTGTRVLDWLLCKAADGSDNTGCSSWDEWEAWGEFRRYMMADFVNDLASVKGTKKVYAMVRGENNVHTLMKNAIFGDNSDPVEVADPTRRPCILPDQWNTAKTDNIDGLIYYVEAVSNDHIMQCADVGRRVDYWVAKAGNTNRGVMPQNEYRPLNDAKVYGIYLDTEYTAAEDMIPFKNAAASVNGIPPFAVMVSKDEAGVIEEKDDFVGNFTGMGIWMRNSDTKQWSRLSKDDAIQITMGDIDGDQKADLVGWWTNPAGIWVRYSSTGNWEKIRKHDDLIWLSTGDINADGRDDVVGSFTFGVWWRNSQNNVWQKLHADSAGMIACGDFNNGGKDDLLGLWDSLGVWIRYSETNEWKKISNNVQVNYITTGDINGDNKIDVVGSWTTLGTWYFNPTSNVWTRLHSVPAEKLAAGDFDGDTLDDLTGVWLSPTGVWFRYSNTGTWERIHQTPATWITAGRMR